MAKDKAKTLDQLRKKRKQLLAQKNWPEALKVMQEMITLDPSTERFINLATLQIKMQLYSEALQSFGQALVLDPGCQRALDGIAKVHNKQEAGIQSTNPSEILRHGMSDLKQLLDDSPKNFGSYIIELELGQGGMGRVYKAYDPHLKRYVAIKTLLQSDNRELASRFAREAESMAQLNHPNIIQIYDISRKDSQSFFAMSLVEGDNLATLIKTKKLTVNKSLAIIKKVALAIEFAHSKGIIHRDLKPSNIMINKDGEPIVMDFGLAIAVDEKARLSKTGDAVGTPAYMAVEQILGKKEQIDKTTDVYALGVILYEMLTGILPFSGEVAYLVMQQAMKGAPTEPKIINKNIPEYLNKACLKAMAKEREKRYPSAKDFAMALERKVAKKAKSNKLNLIYIIFSLVIAFTLGSLAKYSSTQKGEVSKSALESKSSSVIKKIAKAKTLKRSLKQKSSSLSKIRPQSSEKKSAKLKKSLQSKRQKSSSIVKSQKQKSIQSNQQKSSKNSVITVKQQRQTKWLKKYANFVQKYPKYLKIHKFAKAKKEIDILLKSTYTNNAKKKLLQKLRKDLKNFDQLFVSLSKFLSKKKSVQGYIPLVNGVNIIGNTTIIQQTKDKLYLKLPDNKYKTIGIRDIKASYLTKIVSKKANQQFYLGMLLLAEGSWGSAQRYLKKSGKNARAKNLLKQIKLLHKPKVKILNPKKGSLTVSETQSIIVFQSKITSQITPERVVLKNNDRKLDFQEKGTEIRLDHGKNKIQLEVYIPYKVSSYKIAIYNELRKFSFSRNITRRFPKNLPTYRGNFQRTGYFLTKGLRKSPKTMWKTILATSRGYTGLPILHDDTLYVETDHGLYVLDAKTGKKLWHYKTIRGVNPPSIDNNIAYLGCPDGHMYALDIKSQKLKWKYNTGFAVSSPAVEKGVVYFCTINGVFYALNAKNGKIKWKIEKLKSAGVNCPLIAGDLVYWNNYGDLYALDKKNGRIKWSFLEKAYGGLAIADSIVCFGSTSFYAVDALTGTPKWTFGVTGSTFPAIAGKTVYFYKGIYLYALSLYKGKLKWKKKITPGGSSVWRSPIVTKNTVYFGHRGRISFHARDAKTGDILWQYNSKFAEPFINNGVLYYCADGMVYALH